MEREILPLGSMVSVCYAANRGAETVLLVIGHLSLQKETPCHYDYRCVLFPEGIDRGVYYINHSDIHRVIYRTKIRDLSYNRWLEQKAAEYDAYYKHYPHQMRLSADAMRAKMIKSANAAHRLKRWKPFIRWGSMGLLAAAAVGLAAVTGIWGIGICVLILGLLGAAAK